MSWNDGSHYKGDWKKGVPHGLGKLLDDIGTFKINGQKPKTGLYENNILVKEIKQHNDWGKPKTKEPLILSVIP